MVYELMFARPSDGGRPVLGGLIDVDALSKHRYDEKKSGQAEQRAGSSRPQVGGVSGAAKVASAPVSMLVPAGTEFGIVESTYTGAQQNGHYIAAVAGAK
jgi:hypothetical protein